jgi:toxin ParE1/3/4
MTEYSVGFRASADGHLADLYNYLADAASPVIAQNYVGSVINYCLGLADFPFRGTARDDIAPGLRTISYKARTLIVFTIEDQRVAILGVFHGGQNWEATFTG